MKKVMMTMMLLVLVGLLTAMQGNSEATFDREAIERAVLEAHQRMNETGTDVDKFFADILDFDNGMIIQNGQLFKTRQEAYASVKEGFNGVAKVQREYDQTYVTVLSPQYALLTGTGVTKVELTDGRSFSNRFAVSIVYQLKDGQWKLLHGHHSTPM